MTAPLPLTFSPEVAEASAAGAPIVALESTIITHGMPFPQNLETARRVEDTVRAAGAVPATIAVMGGAIHAGLDAERIEIGVQMAAHAIGADHHDGANGIAGGAHDVGVGDRRA